MMNTSHFTRTRDYRDLTIEHLIEVEHEQAERIADLEFQRDALLVWFRASLHQLHALTSVTKQKSQTISRQREQIRVLANNLPDGARAA